MIPYLYPASIPMVHKLQHRNVAPVVIVIAGAVYPCTVLPLFYAIAAESELFLMKIVIGMY